MISVGKARPQIRDLLRLQRDAVLALDRRVDDPVELYVGDRLIARGELQELDGDQAGAGKAKTTSKRMTMPKISFLDHKESAEERELERLFTSKGPA